VEKGNIRLIGATTENPSFEIISALLSRCRVYVLHPLTAEQLMALMQRALADAERGLGLLRLTVEPAGLERIAAYSSGDARSAYNALEVAATLAVEANGGASGGVITAALHKSVRNSDPDAALYWLGRMLEAGEDPLFVVRRLVRMAVEDIGLADPHALELAVAARDAVDFIGMPEGNLALAEAAVYLALAPKSNALYTAYQNVQRDVAETAAEPVPLHLRNAPTSLMKNLGYGEGYQYAHNLDDKIADMQCLPDNLKNRVYYHPTGEGVEKRIQERMQMLRERREAARRKRQE
jgi:putative ATPase